jgi:hypothetical protein
MTREEIADIELNIETPTRKEAIISAIREKYSVDDEIAILRQRDTKPEEFSRYFEFVERVKASIPYGEGDGNG